MKFNVGDNTTLVKEIGGGLNEFGGEPITILEEIGPTGRLYKIEVCLTGEIFTVWDYGLAPLHVDIHVFW